jgi:hypothetical protein
MIVAPRLMLKRGAEPFHLISRQPSRLVRMQIPGSFAVTVTVMKQRGGRLFISSCPYRYSCSR